MIVTSDDVIPKKVATIYFGGTFGCAGEPLSPVANEKLFPLLAEYTHAQNIELIDIAPVLAQKHQLQLSINDSSQANITTFALLFKTISYCIDMGYTDILIIQGTDTVSYTSAFIAYAFAMYSINIIFLVGMQSLLTAHNDSFHINKDTDAFQNLNCAIEFFKGSSSVHNESVTSNNNVWVTSAGLLPAVNIQKIHRTKAPAFCTYELDDKNTAQKNNDMLFEFDEQHGKKKSFETKYLQRLHALKIVPFYCVPMAIEDTIVFLKHAIETKPDALILLGYGAGNFPHNMIIEELLIQAYQQKTLVVITSQVPFGATTADYAAGSWLTNCYVKSGYTLTIASIYSRLCHLLAHTEDFDTSYSLW